MKEQEMIDFIKAALGTEFDYVYHDGDKIRAYIKVFDPEVGLSCYTLETSSREGHVAWDREADGTWCVIGVTFEYGGLHTLREAYKIVERCLTGTYKSKAISGSPSCAF